MMYHAGSFAENDFETYVIGYNGSQPVAALLSIPHVHFLYLAEPHKHISGVPFIFTAVRKIVQQVFSILHTLMVRIPHPPEFIIVQNPPSIPTLALVWLVGKIRGSKIIIDWHNLGYSILALKLGNKHPLVMIAERFESYFGQSAYAHLFVTNAMHDHLIENWHLRGHKVVLHDRPPAHFHKASAFEMHDLFGRLQPSFDTPPLLDFFPKFETPRSTAFTHVDTPTSVQISDFASNPMPFLRYDRPALLVSSTSWTPDEDFSILLDALKLYEEKARRANAEGGQKLPKVLMIVTGKGPDREKYMNEVMRLQRGLTADPNVVDEDRAWRWVRCISLWLEPEDYPLLLGSADLGVSLHFSSSGLDLPMKVVDMFGCGLPVCALNFNCLDELVKDGVNGLVFENAEQLAAQFEALLKSFPNSPALSNLRVSLEQSEEKDKSGNWEWGSWADNWNRNMRPLILKDVHIPGQ